MKPAPGMELVILKWVSPTDADSRKLERSIESLLMGLSKVTSPAFPGWVVCWATYRLSTTLRLVFHVEPEADMTQSASSEDRL